jgi:hypothetical protein
MPNRVAKVSRSRAVKPAETPKEQGTIAPAPPVRKPPSADEIRVRAYTKWAAAGKPPGDGVKFWLQAERDLLTEMQSKLRQDQS